MTIQCIKDMLQIAEMAERYAMELYQDADAYELLCQRRITQADFRGSDVMDIRTLQYRWEIAKDHRMAADKYYQLTKEWEKATRAVIDEITSKY